MFDIYRSEPGSFAGTVEDATLGSALADTEILGVRNTGGGHGKHQKHCVSGARSETLETHTLSKSLVTDRNTGNTSVSSPVSETLDTHLTPRVSTFNNNLPIFADRR